MRFVRHKPHAENPPQAADAQADAPAVISAEADVRRAIREGAGRRRPPTDAFSVLCVVPQAVRQPVTAAEFTAATATIGRELRGADRFCLFDDASYVVALAGTDDEHARVVAERLALALTSRMAPLGRAWYVGVACYPHDARTEAALIEFARLSALDMAA